MPHIKRPSLLFTTLLIATILAACGGSDDVGSMGMATTKPTAGAPLTVLVASSDPALGPNRLVVVLLNSEGEPFGNADVKLRFYHVDGPAPTTVKQELTGMWLGNPSLPQVQPFFSSRPTLDGIGAWDVEAIATKPGAQPVTGKGHFRVKSKSDAPSLGAAAPLVKQKTLADAPIDQLTSEPPGDPDFYKLTITDAINQQKPLMIVFSTPAFCRTRTCGPQLEIAQELKKKYAAQVNFIHIESFDRPDLMRQGQSPKASPGMLAYHLVTEPWVFLVDKKGNVFDKFEGYTPESELEQSVQSLLKS